MHVDRQKKRHRSSADQNTDTIDLPYCEGIQVCGFNTVIYALQISVKQQPILLFQVVMATETQRSPMLQTDSNQEGL